MAAFRSAFDTVPDNTSTSQRRAAARAEQCGCRGGTRQLSIPAFGTGGYGDRDRQGNAHLSCWFRRDRVAARRIVTAR